MANFACKIHSSYFSRPLKVRDTQTKKRVHVEYAANVLAVDDYLVK